MFEQKRLLINCVRDIIKKSCTKQSSGVMSSEIK